MPAPVPVRILVADDHAVVRGGLRLLLEKAADLSVVAEAEDGAQAVQRCLQGDIDLAILDVAMPRMTGIQAVRELERCCPRVRTLILSMHDREQYLAGAIAAGASGYVAKRAADKDIVEACRAVMRGDAFVFPSTASAALREKLARGHASDGLERSLTSREIEIARLVADGHSTRAVAQMLHISIKTVETHRANIYSKLNVRDRVELTRYAIRRGLVEP